MLEAGCWKLEAGLAADQAASSFCGASDKDSGLMEYCNLNVAA
jgi:hypothetical protein